jgi:hypothetical protein
MKIIEGERITRRGKSSIGTVGTVIFPYILTTVASISGGPCLGRNMLNSTIPVNLMTRMTRQYQVTAYLQLSYELPRLD